MHLGRSGGIGGFELNLLCVVHVLHSWVCMDTIKQIYLLMSHTLGNDSNLSTVELSVLHHTPCSRSTRGP